MCFLLQKPYPVELCLARCSFQKMLSTTKGRLEIVRREGEHLVANLFSTRHFTAQYDQVKSQNPGRDTI
jgi:hypothetical protein